MIKTIATFSLAPELKEAKINIPDHPVPVTLNFDCTKILGTAVVSEDGKEFIADISLYDGSVFPKKVAPGGFISSKRIADGAIMEFYLQEVSFINVSIS